MKPNLQLHFELPIVTADGEFLASYSAQGLCGLNFPKTFNSSKATPGGEAMPVDVLAWHVLATKALELALKGRPVKNPPPFDLSVGTDFQRKVWAAMLAIAPGRTQSYGEIAKSIGRPKAVRAVGGACGANPIPVLVPCHRVLAANSRIGGFSSGLPWKRKLLAREGVTPVEV